MNNKKKATLVPKLRFPEFVENGAVICEAGNLIFEQINNKNHNLDLPILAITQEYGAIPRDEIDYTVSVSEKSLGSYKVVEKGDFIISLRSFQGGIEHSMYHGICSPAYVVLRKKVDVVEQYYKHYFKTDRFIQELNKDLEGIRDGKMVRYSQFSAILLPKPDKAEQQKIADCLSSLDDLIALEEKKLSLLQEHKKGLMQKLFPAEGQAIPDWRFPEFKNSKAWEKKKLSQLGDVVSGLTYSPADVRENGLLVLRSSNIRNNRIELEDNVYVRTDMKRVNLSKENDILICVRNGSASLIGKNALIPKGMPLCTHGAFMVVFRAFNPSFVFQLFQSTQYEKQVRADLGATINSINSNQLKKYEFYVPSQKEEQQKVAKCLCSIDEFISLQTERITNLRMYKKGLMQRLFPSIEEVSE